MKTIEQHAEAIVKKFPGCTLFDDLPLIHCDNPAYALCIRFNDAIYIKFWDNVDMLQFDIEDSLNHWLLGQLTIFKIEGDEYRSLNIKVEVVE